MMQHPPLLDLVCSSNNGVDGVAAFVCANKAAGAVATLAALGICLLYNVFKASLSLAVISGL